MFYLKKIIYFFYFIKFKLFIRKHIRLKPKFFPFLILKSNSSTAFKEKRKIVIDRSSYGLWILKSSLKKVQVVPRVRPKLFTKWAEFLCWVTIAGPYLKTTSGLAHRPLYSIPTTFFYFFFWLTVNNFILFQRKKKTTSTSNFLLCTSVYEFFLEKWFSFVFFCFFFKL